MTIFENQQSHVMRIRHSRASATTIFSRNSLIGKNVFQKHHFGTKCYAKQNKEKMITKNEFYDDNSKKL